MPFKSQAQAAAMHAAANGRSTLGIPKGVGEEFVTASRGTSLKGLPKKKGKKGALHHAKQAMRRKYA